MNVSLGSDWLSSEVWSDNAKLVISLAGCDSIPSVSTDFFNPPRPEPTDFFNPLHPE